MAHHSYEKKEYQDLQSRIMKENWKKGVFNFVYKREKRKCARKECENTFEVKKSDPKIYCCSSCSGKVNNIGRVLSEETKLKIGKASIGRPSPFKGILKFPKVEIICANQKCGKLFTANKWAKRKFCGNDCAMAVIGGKPTSHKASKGKGGIRRDISDTIYLFEN